jgi:hypothetical protein
LDNDLAREALAQRIREVRFGLQEPLPSVALALGRLGEARALLHGLRAWQRSSVPEPRKRQAARFVLEGMVLLPRSAQTDLETLCIQSLESVGESWDIGDLQALLMALEVVVRPPSLGRVVKLGDAPWAGQLKPQFHRVLKAALLREASQSLFDRRTVR